MRHLYGRQPHEPHRHTIKENICPTTNTVTPTTTQKNIEAVKPEGQNIVAPPAIQFNSRNEKYFFHTQPCNIKGDILSGEMVPVAIPLAPPCTDPAGRLPLSIIVKNEETEEARRSPRKSKVFVNDWLNHDVTGGYDENVKLEGFSYFDNINPFHATGLFLYLLKILENLRFVGVFRGYRKRLEAWNRLKKL